MHDRNHCCAQMMYTYTYGTYTRRGGAAKIRHAPCSIVPHEFYARLPVTDHRYAPGVTKTKGIHARRDTPLQVEIQTGAGGEGETLPRKFFRSAFVVSIIFSSFLSFLSNFSFFYFYFYLYFLFSRSRPTIFFSRLSIFSTVRMSPLEVYFPASERIDKGCWYPFQYKYLVSLLCIETNARNVASHLRRPR